MSIKVGIIGGAGYTGGELLRILIHHPEVSLTHIHSRSTAGKPISTVHSDLEGDTDLIFTDDTNFVSNGSIDVLFLCLGHGESRKFLQEHTVAANTKIIDLANDFRLKPQSTHNDIQFVYG